MGLYTPQQPVKMQSPIQRSESGPKFKISRKFPMLPPRLICGPPVHLNGNHPEKKEGKRAGGGLI